MNQAADQSFMFTRLTSEARDFISHHLSLLNCFTCFPSGYNCLIRFSLGVQRRITDYANAHRSLYRTPQSGCWSKGNTLDILVPWCIKNSGKINKNHSENLAISRS
jgi:hypothetical protein